MKKFGFPPYYQTNEAVAALQKVDSFKDYQLTIEEEKFHLVKSGDKKAPIILFIHGSPGAWMAWADYLLDQDLRSKSHMIAVDRAGFGGSDNGYHQPSLKKQAKIIIKGVKETFGNDKKFIIIGHSYGGPVALQIAVDYPDLVDSMILLAPSIDPDLEDNRWYNKLASVPFIRPILPTTVDRSNQEILPLKDELLTMRPLLSAVTNKVTIIHGEEDGLVPVGNANFGQKALINAQIDMRIIPNRGHFIPWEEYSLVKGILLDRVSNIN